MDNYKTIELKLRKLEPFKGNSMSGDWHAMGQYVVYSYGTPIAIWQTSLVKDVTTTKYSTTTSRHQNLVRKAWGI